jgi:hypothetical protein
MRCIRSKQAVDEEPQQMIGGRAGLAKIASLNHHRIKTGTLSPRAGAKRLMSGWQVWLACTMRSGWEKIRGFDIGDGC